MTQPLRVRPLTDAEKGQLEQGLRSNSAFTLRRCQILLASARGESPASIARIYGCQHKTVRRAIMDFRYRGILCLHACAPNGTTMSDTSDGLSPDTELETKYRLLEPHLGTRERRLWADVEAKLLGYGGISRVAAATGLCSATVAAGLKELETAAVCEPSDHRGETAAAFRTGRPRVEDKNPEILIALEKLLADEIAGDPMSDQKWVRSSVWRLQAELREQGHINGHSTIARVLHSMGFSLRVNKKRQAGSQHPQRDEQFQYISLQRSIFSLAGLPIISVDTKKSELIGNFRNPGRVWCREPEEVDEKDFPSTAECVAIPFGVYDVTKNTGFVVVGTSHNTPAFAVTSIARWWEEEGSLLYPAAGHLLILADGGGGNGNRARAWKFNLQHMLCNRFGLIVTVCHYPPGCSKWNPIEHRLFSQITSNWQGKPLRSLRIMLNYIRGTTTTTGLTVAAHLDEGIYRKGQKVAREDMAKLRLNPHTVCPDWNYTIYPNE
jgi:hypothetical protein